MDMDWITPGREVATLQHAGFQATPIIRRTTIERVLKRDVVLANGRRFSQHKHRNGGLLEVGASYFGGPRLLPADHPEIVQAEKDLVDHQQANRLRGLMDSWMKDRMHPNADEILAQIRDLIDERLGR